MHLALGVWDDNMDQMDLANQRIGGMWLAIGWVWNTN